MIEKNAVVNIQVGLYARPATFFVYRANQFASNIWIEKDEKRVHAKSLLGVLSLSVANGTEVKLIADGADAAEAVDALAALLATETGEL